MKQSKEDSKTIETYLEGQKYEADWQEVNLMLIDGWAIAPLHKADLKKLAEL